MILGKYQAERQGTQITSSKTYRTSQSAKKHRKRAVCTLMTRKLLKRMRYVACWQIVIIFVLQSFQYLHNLQTFHFQS